MQGIIKTNPIDAINAAPTMGRKYGFASSRDILNVFEAQNWQVERTLFGKSAKHEGFQKHMVWLKNAALPTIAGLSKDNESSVRLCLVNAHNGTARLQVFLGIMRHACLNQILGGSIFRYFGAVHSKSILTRLEQGIGYVTQGIPDLISNIQNLQATSLGLEQRLELAKLVLPSRFENVNGLLNYDATIVERALRNTDVAQDAYTVANRLQEYLIRGGIPYSYTRNVKDKDGTIIDNKIVHTRTRQVASIGTQIKLNEVLLQSIKQVA